MSNNMYRVDSSPGPRYYVDAKITRFGRDGDPSYSILGRVKAQRAIFQTPGPGAYSPETPTYNTRRKPPSYTMGSRTRYRTVDAVPAPNKYSLPALMGPRVPNKAASSSFTMAALYKTGGPSEDLSKTPGPCKYNCTDPSVYLRRQPAFSMLGRRSLPQDSTKKPGPGTHNPEKVTVDKPRAPAFSLGTRHSEFVTPLIVQLAD